MVNHSHIPLQVSQLLAFLLKSISRQIRTNCVHHLFSKTVLPSHPQITQEHDQVCGYRSGDAEREQYREEVSGYNCDDKDGESSRSSSI
jgi:hypothetical protein